MKRGACAAAAMLFVAAAPGCATRITGGVYQDVEAAVGIGVELAALGSVSGGYRAIP